VANYSPKITTAQIKMIQTVRRSAGIDDDVYSEMKKSVGVSSTTELDQRRFQELLRRISKLQKNASRRRSQQETGSRQPYKKVHSSAYKSGMHLAPAEDKALMLSKIEAILTDLSLPWSYADATAKRMFGVDLLRWCDETQTYKVLQALAVYQKRKAGKMEEAAFYIKELRSDGCQCGGRKKSGQSLCYGCYKKLPADLAKALWRKLGNGYEQAYDRAVAWLTGEE